MQVCLLLSLSLVVTALASNVDDDWLNYLETPPARAVSLAQNLSSRAANVASRVKASWNHTGPLATNFDVVCSGGGDLNAYYLGIESIFRRLRLPEQRHAGASAGGWLSFELALKGEETSLLNYLSYGVLEERYPLHFSTVLTSVQLQDHHWRMMYVCMRFVF